MSFVQYSLIVVAVFGAEMRGFESCAAWDAISGPEVLEMVGDVDARQDEGLVDVNQAGKGGDVKTVASALDADGAEQVELVAVEKEEEGADKSDKAEKDEGEAVEVKRELDEAAVKLLDKLEEKGREIKTFDARVNHVRIQELLGDQQVRIGRVMLMRGEEKTQFAIYFDYLFKDGGKKLEQKRHYIFDGEWLVEKDYSTKTYIKRQVIKPGEKFDPLKLGEGPFPLPLGQKREEVLKMFDAKMIEDPVLKDPQGKPLPAKLHLQLTPRKDIPKSAQVGKFKKLDIWYEPEQLLPVKVQTTDGKNTTRVELFRPAINTLNEVDQKTHFDVTPPKGEEGWDIIIKPFGDAG